MGSGEFRVQGAEWRRLEDGLAVGSGGVDGVLVRVWRLLGGLGVRLQEGDEFGGRALRFVVGDAGADVGGGGVDEGGAVLVEDLVGKLDADAGGGFEPELDGEEIVVAGGGFVGEVGVNDGEGEVAFLPVEEGGAKVAEEFSAGGFEEVEVTGVVDVIAEGALGVGDAVGVLVGLVAHGAMVAEGGGVSRAGREMKGCVGGEREYVWNVNWQEIVALGIVAATAGLFAWNRLRPRKFSLVKDTHCGCSSPGGSAGGNTMVFRARRGERGQIVVKMK